MTVPRAISAAHVGSVAVLNAAPPALLLIKKPPPPLCIWGNTAAGIATKARSGNAHALSFLAVRHARRSCMRANTCPCLQRAGVWAPPSHDSRRFASPPRASQAAFRELPDSDAGLQAALHEFHDLTAAYASNRLSLCPDSQRGKYRAMLAAHLHLAGDTAAALQRHNDAK